MDLIPLSELNESHRQLIGGKGYALDQLISQGYNVPPGFCVTTLLYDQFLDQTDSVVVRSSACDEDCAGSSFAGLHESYVNVCGFDAVIKHIQLVWASLWSDRALLYRRELGLEVEHSAMAVVVQLLVRSNFSGIVFSRNPNDPEQTIVEAVSIGS